MQRSRASSLGPVALVAALCSACAIKQVPPKARVIERVDLLTADRARIDQGEVAQHIATRATSHFLPFELLAGVPVLGVLDAVTVEYHVFDPFVLQRDLDRIRRYYRARGFYEAEISAARVVPSAKQRVRVEIAIKEGEPVWIESVEAPKELLPSARDTAEADALLSTGGPIQRLIRAFATTPLNDPARCDKPEARCGPRPRLDEERYDELKRQMRRILTDAGFAYARVDGHIDVDVLRREARVRFSVTPGPLCRFGEIRVTGNGEIPEAIIRERIGFVTGERFSSARLDSAHDELAELGVFGSVELAHVLAQGIEPPPRDVPIRVNVQPIKLRAIKAGSGALVGSQLEAHALLGWEDRNLLGGLRSFAVEARQGVVFYPTTAATLFSALPTRAIPQLALLTAFTQPSFPEKRTDLRLQLEGRIHAPQLAAPEPGENIVGYYELKASAGFDRKFRFPRIDRSSVYAGGFLKLQLDFPFSYNEDAPPANYQRVLIPYLDAILAWDFRKDRSDQPTRIEPYRGVHAALDSQVAFGDAVDLRFQPEVKLYKPIVDRVVVALRWTTGLVFPFNYGSSLRPENFAICNGAPPVPGAAAAEVFAQCARDLQLLSFRAFYSGGPFSNRGYGFREVGPHGELQFLSQVGSLTGLQPTGGMGMWELAGELRFLLKDKLSLVAFLDASDVVRTIRDFRFDYPHLSPGAGLRIATPVGPIRLDLGFRPPYLQKLGAEQLAPTEGGPAEGQDAPFPWAWSLAIGEAF